MGNEKMICLGCGSGNVVKKGKRKSKYEAVQKYFCNDCSRFFTFKKLEKKVYPAKVIMQAIGYYNLGNSLDESSKLIYKKLKIKISPRVISNWLQEFRGICSYYRIRDRAISLFKPSEVVFKKIFRHLQVYKYRYHKAKIEFFANEYFSMLKNYLFSISKNCPHDLFINKSTRGSGIKLDIDFSKVKVFRKENYACKLASLALEAASKNTERHEKLQEFMLCNDSCTVACEVPIYVYPNEIDSSIFNFIDLKNKNAITGHIDFVQLKFGSVYVLDYKPDASKVNAISQLFVYALALSLRTGIWLRNFRCAWFDQDFYYEFAPSDIVLRFCKVPAYRAGEFFVRNNARRYFTSEEFQQARTKNLGFKDIGRILRKKVMRAVDVERVRIADSSERNCKGTRDEDCIDFEAMTSDEDCMGLDGDLGDGDCGCLGDGNFKCSGDGDCMGLGVMSGDGDCRAGRLNRAAFGQRRVHMGWLNGCFGMKWGKRGIAKRGIIALLIAMLLLISLYAHAFTFIDDSDADFGKGNLSVDSRVFGTGYPNPYYQTAIEKIFEVKP